MNLIDYIALTWLGLINALGFLVFGIDKWRAGRSRDRISELTLTLFGALGGWPGGLLGMLMFRHKTAKWAFKLKYALALIPFAALIWAWLRFR